jgi:hypothetical protein
MDKTAGLVISTFKQLSFLTTLSKQLLDGDGSSPETDMFAKFPRTPSDSVSNTPGGPRRRIRCKMCRYAKLSILSGFLQIDWPSDKN